MNEKRFIRVLWLVKASLVVALAYAGLRAITGHLNIAAFDPGTVSGDERLTDVEPAETSERPRADYTQILQSRMFSGTDDPAHPDPSQPLDSMPSAEELGLRLVGGVAGGPAVSRAIIQNTKSNATGVYKIGDTVASATVEAIQQDAVVLRYQDHRLILRRHAGPGDADKPPAEDADLKTEAKPPAAAGPAPLPPVKGDYMSEIFRKATIEPYVKNRQVEGLRITGLDKLPMAELFGLKDGDIIRRVNGQQLTSKQKAFQVLMKARTQSKVDIELLRNGKSKDLSFGL